MKTTAQLPALLLSALAVTAFAAETPAPAPVEAVAPAPAASSEPAVAPAPETAKPKPAKAEPAATTPSTLSPSNGPAAAPNLTPFVKPPPEEKPEDPEVLKLPKMVVKQKPRPRLTPEIMVTRQAFGEDLARQKNTQLDQVLNKFTLPLFGTSAAERALDEHEREKRAQLNLDVLNLVKVLETTDPNEAKSLKEAARP